jgi:cytochrome c
VRYVLLTMALLALGCGDDRYVRAYLVAGGNWRAGRDKIQYYGCGSCHTIPGVTGADGMVGPPLTKFAHRVYIGGVLGNTPDNLVRWIENPKAVDQLTAMPNLNVTTNDARDIATFLYTLR